MEKQKAVNILTTGHQEFKEILSKLKPNQIESIPAVGKWPVRDVIAHITAWYWEFIREIDGILADRPIINIPSGDDAFNEKEVAAR